MNYYEQTVQAVREDFEQRRKERLRKELIWQINMNFLAGNQYCGISPNNAIETSKKDFFWQHREVFNHIAPVMESRSSKLLRTRPKVRILPSDSEKSNAAAAISERLVNSVFQRINMQKIISDATTWSEATGTAFYKVTWNSSDASSGFADVTVCPPFEIYPDSMSRDSVEACQSIIHARVLPVSEIKRIWKVDVSPESMLAFSPLSLNGTDHRLEDCATVIEKYEKPTDEYPLGRLTIVASDKLLYVGNLPYSQNGSFCFPFIRQVSVPAAGEFFGASIIERLIPVQRAYNEIKNKKHELLCRLAGGIIAVEEGSINIDELEDEGLYPGKILVYRQGSSLPVFLQSDKLPADFITEEERLLNEFTVISGVSDLMRSSSPVKVTSGTALNLLLEQDDSRISVSADQINSALKETSYKLLRLFKMYLSKELLESITGVNEADVKAFLESDDSVSILTESEGNSAPVRMMSIALELYNSGILNDKDGNVPLETKNKLLQLMGLNSLM